MPGALEALQTQRGLEDAYYESLTPSASAAINLRNKGKDLVLAAVKDGDHKSAENGLDQIESSIRILGGAKSTVMFPQYMDLTYQRDLYASLGMAARMHAAVGNIGDALTFARHAVQLTPAPVVYEYALVPEDFGPVGSPLRVNAESDPSQSSTIRRVFVDQYEVIFSGRLALILSSSTDRVDVRNARELASRNWLIAPREQDPSRVAFPDNEKTTEERREDQRKRKVESWVVAVGTRIPVRKAREKVAIKACSK